MSEEASIFEVVESGFDCYVIENSCKVPVLVEFMGVWSEPCALMADILSDLANGRTGRHRDAAGIYCKGIVVFDLRPYHASISSLLGGANTLHCPVRSRATNIDRRCDWCNSPAAGPIILSQAGGKADMRIDKVECYAGYRGEEEPRRFRLGERWVGVREVLDRWLAPEHRYFKLRADDGDLYILRQDVPLGDWEMTLYERRP